MTLFFDNSNVSFSKKGFLRIRAIRCMCKKTKGYRSKIKRNRLCQLFCGQAIKSKRWMPWHQEAKKDVVGCDKLRGVAEQALIRRYLNGETRHCQYDDIIS